MRIRAALLSLVLALPAVAARNQMLVSTDWLQQHLDSVTIVYVGDRPTYDAGHVPGAVFVDIASLVTERDGIPNELPPIATLEQVFRAAGVDARKRIVVYSIDPIYAARAWFTLDYLGQGDRTAVLDGGFAKWSSDGCRVSRDAVTPKPGSFVASVEPQVVVGRATMHELIRLRDQLGSSLIVVDARSARQFSGAEPGPEVLHGGHIPGAVNVPFAQNFASDGTFLSEAQLRNLYAGTGVTEDSANVTYCRTGMQAAVTFFVLEYLGYDAVLYDGSFIEWSAAGEIIET